MHSDHEINGTLSISWQGEWISAQPDIGIPSGYLDAYPVSGELAIGRLKITLSSTQIRQALGENGLHEAIKEIC